MGNKMTSDFILERLEVIGGSASEKDSGNEIAERMYNYLQSHKQGNENEIKKALLLWENSDTALLAWLSKYLLKELELK